MNVFSTGNRARCYQNWNGICWNRETVAMEKWSNTAPCSCHALMSRILFEKEKEEKKQWGKKGKAVERRGRCRKLGRILDKNGKKLRLKAGGKWEIYRKENHVHWIWCGSDQAGQMVSMNRIWPPDWVLCAGTLLHPLPPSLHPIILPFNTSSSLSVRTHNFQVICNYSFNFGPL